MTFLHDESVRADIKLGWVFWWGVQPVAARGAAVGASQKPPPEQVCFRWPSDRDSCGPSPISIPLSPFCYLQSQAPLVDVRVFPHRVSHLGITGPPPSRRASCCNEARGCAHINTDIQDQQRLPLFFFSLLYKRQNSLNKGKQITAQVGMFIT